MNVQDEIKELKQRIAELEEQAKEEREFPQDGDAYWYINPLGFAFHDEWSGFITERHKIEIGNVFKTKEQADFAVEKLKVEAELQKFGRPFKCGEINHYIFLNTDNECLDVVGLSYSQYQGTIYFESRKKANEAVESVGEERIKKYIFGVEEQ